MSSRYNEPLRPARADTAARYAALYEDVLATARDEAAEISEYQTPHRKYVECTIRGVSGEALNGLVMRLIVGGASVKTNDRDSLELRLGSRADATRVTLCPTRSRNDRTQMRADAGRVAHAVLTFDRMLTHDQTDEAVARFGVVPVALHAAGKIGQAYASVALSVIHAAQGQRIGMTTSTDPAALTLAVLLADAALTRTYGDEFFQSTLKTNPGIVATARLLDADLTPGNEPTAPTLAAPTAQETPETPSARRIVRVGPASITREV